ncbi:MAG: LCP family protein [Candidatus Magasanikbacteria bacterium]|nr:LCP family protein [Candidatus Magasanikbacteria bacterium]
METRRINFLDTHNPTEIQHELPPRQPRKWRIFLIILTLLIIAGGMIRIMAKEYAPNDPSAYDPVTLEPKKPEGLLNKISHLVFSREYELNGYSDDRINILLLGIGGIGHDGPFLTDTIMLVGLKPSTGEIATVSIPRDLGTEIPGQGINKINSASAFGEAQASGSGAEFAAEVVEKTFGQRIHYYARVDFKAFEEIIDELGGITINVEKSFTDQMYPTENHDYQTIAFIAGIQTMDGETALKFVRSRHGDNGEGSDFARARRQQKAIFALKEKVLSFSTLANPIKINNIRKSLMNHITTDLKFSDLMSFFKLMRELKIQKLTTVVLDDSVNGFLQSASTPAGAFILVPKTGDFKAINDMIENIFEATAHSVDDTPEQTAPALTPAAIEIQNGTWIAGLAARMGKRLEDKNFIISAVGNTEQKPMATSGIYKINPDAPFDTLQALQKELRVPIRQTLPANVSPTSSADILVLLGEDMNE